MATITDVDIVTGLIVGMASKKVEEWIEMSTETNKFTQEQVATIRMNVASRLAEEINSAKSA